MIILAIDTSETRGSVAVRKAGELTALCEHHSNDDYSSWLIPAVEKTLALSRSSLAQVDVFAASTGPGSFTGLRVMVPQSNALAVGLRSVIRSNDTTKVLGFLEKGKLNSHHDWKHRFKENSERMRTGSLLEVAVVLKSLVSLSRSKPLSFREKKMLERAKYLLVSEMATARNLTAENAEGLVVKSLAKAKLQFPMLQEKFE